MNILIDGAENARTYTNVDRETTSYRTQKNYEKIESLSLAETDCILLMKPCQG